ncbi:SLAP domain-containing protein [Lacticaseibacillus pabuli]|uniref:SLAP domain-containing protein n=1 Tax=Lacticaseibacillus pabuli TaxID=3025672 RepID=A0ABY7WUP7_9LACO|nr:SLAP domain-containing protein [Lacticaseibacillus sp. KACC 23028]WDF82865.1 SLAP domain-containing protein [Lacticaseibacillus sp. KACC 23028]
MAATDSADKDAIAEKMQMPKLTPTSIQQTNDAISALKDAVAATKGSTDSDTLYQVNRAEAIINPTGDIAKKVKASGYDYTTAMDKGYYVVSGAGDNDWTGPHAFDAAAVNWQASQVIGRLLKSDNKGPLPDNVAQYVATHPDVAASALNAVDDIFDTPGGADKAASEKIQMQQAIVKAVASTGIKPTTSAGQTALDEAVQAVTDPKNATNNADSGITSDMITKVAKMVPSDVVQKQNTPSQPSTSYVPTATVANSNTVPATNKTKTPATVPSAETIPVKKNAGVTIKGVAKTTEGTPIYDGTFAASGRTLPKNTNWKVSNVTVAPNGDVFYKVGTNQYVRADAAKLNTNAAQDLKGDTSIAVKKVATVKYVPGYGIQVWKNDFKTMVKNADGSAKKLADKTSWKVSGIVKHNGHVFYRVGSNQYIDASYATLK